MVVQLHLMNEGYKDGECYINAWISYLLWHCIQQHKFILVQEQHNEQLDFHDRKPSARNGRKTLALQTDHHMCVIIR